MLAWQGGDRDAWGALTLLLFPHLCVIFRTMHGAACEDLAQETLWRMLKAGNFDPRKNRDCDHPFMAWVSTIAHHVSLDQRKRDAHHSEKTTAATGRHQFRGARLTGGGRNGQRGSGGDDDARAGVSGGP
jgi:DNA-directed RNA polymerase specialized sigma24 family protein